MGNGAIDVIAVNVPRCLPFDLFFDGEPCKHAGYAAGSLLDLLDEVQDNSLSYR